MHVTSVRWVDLRDQLTNALLELNPFSDVRLDAWCPLKLFVNSVV